MMTFFRVVDIKEGIKFPVLHFVEEWDPIKEFFRVDLVDMKLEEVIIGGKSMLVAIPPEFCCEIEVPLVLKTECEFIISNPLGAAKTTAVVRFIEEGALGIEFNIDIPEEFSNLELVLPEEEMN